MKLTKKPTNPIIIEGFPGFGLVGSIAAEFLVEHLKAELIGNTWFEDLPSTIAIHGEKIVNPLGAYYSKKKNIIIIHSITGGQGMEWKIADIVVDIAKTTKAKQIISMEGVGSMTPTDESRIYYFTNNEPKRSQLKKLGLNPLKEGIIMGVTAALLLKIPQPIVGLFAETHSELPDSKAAAKVIEVINEYLNLSIDTKPLLKMADQFEEKIKGIIQQGVNSKDQQEKKNLSYVG